MQGVSINERNGFAFSSPPVFSNPETLLPEKRDTQLLGYTAPCQMKQGSIIATK